MPGSAHCLQASGQRLRRLRRETAPMPLGPTKPYVCQKTVGLAHDVLRFCKNNPDRLVLSSVAQSHGMFSISLQGCQNLSLEMSRNFLSTKSCLQETLESQKADHLPRSSAAKIKTLKRTLKHHHAISYARRRRVKILKHPQTPKSSQKCPKLVHKSCKVPH